MTYAKTPIIAKIVRLSGELNCVMLYNVIHGQYIYSYNEWVNIIYSTHKSEWIYTAIASTNKKNTNTNYSYNEVIMVHIGFINNIIYHIRI